MATSADKPEDVGGLAPAASSLPVLDPALYGNLLDACPEGVVICDASAVDAPVVYVNSAFEQLTGYPSSELIGRNLRFLHGDDKEQDGLTRIRLALREHTPCHTVLRNYRKDGTLFRNEMRLVPLRDTLGKVTHYASFHRGADMRLRADKGPTEARDPALNTQTMLAYMREDKLTGLLRQAYFDEMLKRDWAVAQREGRALSLFVFDLDFYESYRDLFGRPGADQTLRRISRTIGACFRRASDMVARYDESRIAALTAGMDSEHALRHGELVLTRVRDLAIHHPRSAVSRYMTISAGVATIIPARDADSTHLIETALKALKFARDSGRNQVAAV